MIPEYNKGQAIHIEHMMRYLFASQYIRDKMVLDIACGSGYGSNELLEAGARRVIGIDISVETIEYCKKTYPNTNLGFMVGGVEKIPVANNSIDVIVSFETIEHVDEKSQKDFFVESKRILTDDGVLIISTPNSEYYPAGNKYHIKEFNKNEFLEVLSRYFRNIRLYYQSDELGRGIYMTAVCGNGVNMHPHDPGATYFSKIDISSLATENEDAKSKIRDLEHVVGLRDAEINSKNGEIRSLVMNVEEMNKKVSAKDQEVQNRNQEILRMESSKFWKIKTFYEKFKNPVLQFVKLSKKAWYVYRRDGMVSMLRRVKKHVIYKRNVWKQNRVKPETYDIKYIGKLDIATVKEIVFVKTGDPVVSIIIPVFNQWRYTYNCLDSLLKNITGTSFEVIIVDDGSTDETVDMLKKVKNIVYVKNNRNLGFVGSCNAGAKKAKGKYVVFLNNDTFIKAHWLSALLDTFKNSKNIGLVGSKLIYPDGRLQEAGGIVWKNENAWNYGRYQNPNAPEYNYLKDVDYCSGASVMLQREVFEKLGGFDEIFSPGYCEDTDLAFRVRRLGLRTVYQPRSELFHFEGITSGNDLKKGMKKYQSINSEKFFKRWHDVLQKENLDDAEDNVFQARDRSKGRKTVLFMDNNVPTSDRDAGSFITFQYLKILSDLNYKVIFWPHNMAILEPYTGTLQQMGIEVMYGEESFSNYIHKYGKSIEFAFIARPHVARIYMDLVKRNSSAKILYIAHDLHFLRETRTADVVKNEVIRKIAASTKLSEEKVMRSSDVSLFFSDREVEIVEDEFVGVLAKVIPWIQEIENTNPTIFEHRKGLIFIGGYNHQPNVDAVKWFHKEIFPRVIKKIPNIEVTLYGSQVPKEILDLNASNFKVIGFVKEEEIKDIFNSARIFIAPLRYGAGFKGKIAKAMSNGLPVVTTDIGAEGIGLTDGENALITENPEVFADKIVQLYSDKILWNHISKNSLDHVINNYSVHNVKYKIEELLAIDERVVKIHEQIEEQSNYQKKIQQELAIYEKQVKVHDLPEIYHYWSNKYLAPIFKEAGFASMDEFFSSNLIEAKNRTGSLIANFVSVGAGNCDLEVSVAKNLISSGFKDFIFECLEINPVMIERGKEIARENGVFNNMRFVEADFNTWISDKKYDGVMVNQSLHHVTNLEHLFEQINKGLDANGSFVISDMIGRNGHQRWPEALEIVNKYWRELPKSHKFNVLLNRLENEYENWDCSKEGFEGIRAQDIVPLLLEQFECEKFIGFVNAVDIFVDRCFGPNFDPKSEWDKEFIDRVHAEDEEAIVSGKLTPTHMLAVFVKKMHVPAYYSRGVSPRLAVRLANK